MFFKRLDSINAARGRKNTTRMQRRRDVFFIEFQDSYSYPVQYPHLKVFLFFQIIQIRNERIERIVVPYFRQNDYAVIFLQIGKSDPRARAKQSFDFVSFNRVAVFFAYGITYFKFVRRKIQHRKRF